MMEAEIGIIQLKAYGHQGFLTTPKANREVWNRFFPGGFRERMALQTLISDASLPKL